MRDTLEHCAIIDVLCMALRTHAKCLNTRVTLLVSVTLYYHSDPTEYLLLGLEKGHLQFSQ